MHCHFPLRRLAITPNAILYLQRKLHSAGFAVMDDMDRNECPTIVQFCIWIDFIIRLFVRKD
jgi:hypothetical protein